MDTKKLREVLSRMSSEELEDVREIVSEESGSRGRKRELKNKFLIRNTNVRLVRSGVKLPRGAEGVIVKMKRKKAIIYFENFGNYDVPLSMFEQID